MIDALLAGVMKALTETQGLADTEVGLRAGGSGKPYAGYKGGGWYFGLYFGGCQNSPSTESESYELIYTVGLDVTRVLPQVPTANRGEWLIQPGELYRRAQGIHQMMLRADSVMATYCNDALQSRYNVPAGVGFYSDFDTGSMDRDRTETGDWIAAETEVVPTILVLPMTFSGLKFVAPLERIPLI